MSKSSLPQIPGDLAALLVEVSAEIQRLSATGFVKKVTTLTARRRELPVLLRAHLSSTWFEPWWKDATVIEQTVELLGLPAVPTAPSPDATPQQEGTMPCGVGPSFCPDEAWLRRQLDGLGDQEGA
jgi:hypothetical protein